MIKCKWAGDQADEYCKSCDGVTMEVGGNSISCDQCAGYEAGTEEAGTTEEPAMNEPVEETAENKLEETKVEDATKNKQKSTQKSKETKKTNNNTPKQEKAKNEEKTKETTNEDKVVKVAQEKNVQETVSTNDGEIKVTSLRYTSGATIKKGDNYFKFVAEEEWDVSQIANMSDDIREMLWAKLNAQVDSQIEELKNM